MTRVHSRPEATELRSGSGWLLCTEDGELEAATRPRYELVGEPDRALGLASNDDLVGWERQEGVLDRLQRVGVTDVTPVRERRRVRNDQATRLLVPARGCGRRLRPTPSAGATSSVPEPGRGTLAFEKAAGIGASRATTRTLVSFVSERLC